MPQWNIDVGIGCIVDCPTFVLTDTFIVCRKQTSSLTPKIYFGMLLIAYCIITITVTVIVYVVFLPADSKISDGVIETHNVRKYNPPAEKSLLRVDSFNDSDIDNELYYSLVYDNPTEFDWSAWEVRISRRADLRWWILGGAA